jgi:hypothetical protein
VIDMLSTGGGGGGTGSGRSFPALGFDPAEGDAGAVQAVMLSLATTQETITATLPRLQEAAQITDDSEWGGSAAEEFSDHGDDLPQGLGKGAESIAAVSTALGDWAGKLAANQAKADDLERKAKKLKEQIKQAEADLNDAAGALNGLESGTPRYNQAYDSFLQATNRAATLDDALRKVIDEATRLKARHLREATATAEAIRSGPDDAFEPENDTWYVQALDGIAVTADYVSIAAATAAAGLALTGVGALGPAEVALAISGVAGGVGSLAEVGKQVAGSGNAVGWPATLIGVGTSALPGGGTIAAGVRNGVKIAASRGSKAAIERGRKELAEAISSGGLPGVAKNLRELREHGLSGKASRELTNTGRDVAKRHDIYDKLPKDVAARKAALQELGLAQKQTEAYVSLVDNGTKIAEKAGIELTPGQKRALELAKLGFNPTSTQVDSAAQNVAGDYLKGDR